MSTSTLRQPARRAPLRHDIHGAFVRRTVLDGANLSNANLSAADATNASFRGANFDNADLTGTILRGADLTDARNLTVEQLSKAVIDETTKLPVGLAAELEALQQPKSPDA